MRNRYWAIAPKLLLQALLLPCNFALHAATLTVTTTNDAGTGSLRQVIQTATSGDSVNFSVAGTITLTNGELLITNNLTIAGPGATNLAVSGNNQSRIFEIGSNATVSISGLTIGDGHTGDGTNGVSGSPGGNGGNGGGLYNAGTLTVFACTFTKNGTGRGGSPGGASGSGGGLYNNGTLTLVACVITNNGCGIGGSGSPPGNGGGGGGLYNDGSLTVSNCSISGNYAGPGYNGSPGGNGGDGGGIYNSGTSTLTASTVRSNSAGRADLGFGGGKNGGAGGGIYNIGTLALTACTLAGNTAGIGGNGNPSLSGSSGGPGGGLCNFGTSWLTNCTLSANSGGPGGLGGLGMFSTGGTGGPGGSGGGIYNASIVLSMACTLSGNSGGRGGPGGPGGFSPPIAGGNGGFGGSGGGIYNGGILGNSLVASNYSGAGGSGGTGSVNGSTGSPGAGPDLAGSFASQGYNLISRKDGSLGFTNGANGDLVGTGAAPLDPRLGPLTNNGGPTLTIALLYSSPAIDAGDDALFGPTFNLTADQRGLPRKSGAHVDIGAFERQGLVLTRVAVAGSNVTVSFIAEIGSSYRLERKDNLGPGSWSTVADNLAGAGSILQVLDSGGANQAQRFYRARTVP